MIKLGEVNTAQVVKDYIRNNQDRKELIEIVANGLFKAWFPKSQPVSEDLTSWVEIAVLDAYEAVKALETARKFYAPGKNYTHNNNTIKPPINNRYGK